MDRPNSKLQFEKKQLLKIIINKKKRNVFSTVYYNLISFQESSISITHFYRKTEKKNKNIQFGICMTILYQILSNEGRQIEFIEKMGKPAKVD